MSATAKLLEAESGRKLTMTAEYKVEICWYEKCNMLRIWKNLKKWTVERLLDLINTLFLWIGSWFFYNAVINITLLHYGEEQDSTSLTSNLTVMAMSVVLGAVMMLGLVGNARQDIKMLNGYMACILIIVFMEVVTVIFLSWEHCELQLGYLKQLQTDFHSNATRNESVWDKIQSEHGCCGVNGPEDYAANGRPISVSCCEKAYKAKTEADRRIMYLSCLESTTYYPDGCNDIVRKSMEECSDGFLAFILIITGLKILGLFLAQWIVKNAKCKKVRVFKNAEKI